MTGLAWTAVGGEILFVEVSLSKGKGNLTLTGNLGDVMKESATIAYEYLKSHALNLGIDPDVFPDWNVHIHVPEGATPKDGPSAGITMLTALASAFTQRKIHSDLAMVAFASALLRHPDPGADTDPAVVPGLLETAVQHGTSRLQPELERLFSAARERATRDERRFLPVVARRIDAGSLAETLRDRSVTGEPLADILSDLVFCGKTNLPSGMVG